MARLAVYDHNQKETEQPRRFVKRSAGQSLVRRCLAYWIIENAVLRMIPPREVRPVREVVAVKTFIPQEMPPVEVNGCRFDDPMKNPRQPRLSSVSRRDRVMQTDDLAKIACDLMFGDENQITLENYLEVRR